MGISEAIREGGHWTAELIIAHKELVFQVKEKGKRAAGYAFHGKNKRNKEKKQVNRYRYKDAKVMVEEIMDIVKESYNE